MCLTELGSFEARYYRALQHFAASGLRRFHTVFAFRPEHAVGHQLDFVIFCASNNLLLHTKAVALSLL
jgi:hypothetical protein